MASGLYSVARSLESGRAHTVAREVLGPGIGMPWRAACPHYEPLYKHSGTLLYQGRFVFKAHRLFVLLNSRFKGLQWPVLREMKKKKKRPWGCRSRIRSLP